MSQAGEICVTTRENTRRPSSRRMPAGNGGPIWETQLNRVITEGRHPWKVNREESGTVNCGLLIAECLMR
jgi:hypothetical protein